MNRCGKLLLPVAVLLLAGAGHGHAEPVYKWVDENGQVHYSQHPPARGTASELDLRINTYEGPATIEEITAVAGNRPVTLYTTSWCGVCKRAKAHLASKGVTFRDLDIERDRSARSEYERLGGRGVPLIVVGNRRMHGFDAARLDRMLAADD